MTNHITAIKNWFTLAVPTPTYNKPDLTPFL